MYSIRFIRKNRERILVGDENSIFSIACVLDDARIHFKVADIRGFVVSQNQLGRGGFKYWLDDTDSFPE